MTDDVLMDIFDRRQSNLRKLVDSMFAGKNADMAAAIAREPSYISRCLSDKAHRKKIGEAFARHIEKSLSLQSGWMDLAHGDALLTGFETSRSPSGQPEIDLVWLDTAIVEDGEPIAADEIDLPFFREVELAAGDGSTQVVENHGHTKRFSLSRLSRANVAPDNAACAILTGSSMEPVISDGSPVGIDKADRHITDGKIYALEHGGMLRIKRLYRMPLNRMRLVSENADEYPEEVYSLADPDAPRIIGRVFWWEVFD